MNREELNKILAPHLQNDELKRVLGTFDSLAGPALMQEIDTLTKRLEEWETRAEHIRKWIETFRGDPAVEGILRMCNEAIEWRNNRDRHREELERQYAILERYRRKVIELYANIRDLKEVMGEIARQGPGERFGSNVPARCLEWIVAVRKQATQVLDRVKRNLEELENN